jgi:hypothetical protein
VQVLPEVSKVRFAEPAAAAKEESAAEPSAVAAAAAEGASGGNKAAIRPGSSGGRKASAASKGKQLQRRRFYDTSSESDWSDSEVRPMRSKKSKQRATNVDVALGLPRMRWYN